MKPMKNDWFNLSPMQASMLFQALHDEQPGVNVQQLICAIPNTQPDTLRRAWESLFQQADILRLGFDWSAAQPRQRIYEIPSLPWQELDWRGSANAELQLTEFLQADRLQGFILDQPPLMRLTLIRRDETRFWLVWTYHHALSDGRSKNLLFQRLARIYRALQGGTEYRLPPVRPYRDYIQWLEQQDWTDARHFWAQRMRGAKRLALPGFAAPVQDSPLPYGRVKLQLSQAETSPLKDFARAHDLTLNSLIQGAWAILLQRYTGEADISFGVVRSTRSFALGGEGTRDMLGMWINTLPLRVQADSSMPARQVLRSLRDQTLALRGTLREHLPLAEIQSLSAGGALFDTLVAFESFDMNETLRSLDALFADWEFELHEHLGYPLALEAYGGNRLFFHLEYSLALHDESSARRVLTHLQNILTAISKNPEEPVSRLAWMNPHEREQAEAWGTGQKTGGWRDVVSRFEKQAEKTPRAKAARKGAESWTYAQLNARANRVAWALKKRGAGRDTLVGIYMRRGFDLLAALLGVWKAGAAYVPIDPNYPQERRAYLLADSGVKMALTQKELWSETPQVEALYVEDLQETEEKNPPRETQAEDLAYMIYTSGSTGKPKGAQITQGGLSAYLAWCLRAYPQDGSGSPLHTSLSFDLTVTSIYPALLSGKTVWILDEGLEALGEALRGRHDFSLVKITPAHLQMLTAQVGQEEMRGSTRAFVIGGENLTWEHVRAWKENAPQIKLFNEYGPTETVVGCSAYEIKGGERGSIPIGRPIENAALYVLDSAQNLVPMGVSGELYIGGAGVARGYWRRDDLTRERFVQTGYGRLYKSGDLARWRWDGELEYLGRLDEQVKVRGYRIELGEVESALLELPGVSAAAVAVQEGRLVGFFSGAAGADELREALRQTLPEYMQLSALLKLAELPLTINGKVDKARLPQAQPAASGAAYEAPQGEVEENLAQIWSDLLNLPRVGRGDNFFELGGHSLLSMRLFLRVKQSFGVEIPLRGIFASANLSLLAGEISRARAQRASSVELFPPRQARIPLSFSQQRLWFLRQLDPQGAAYHVPAAFRLRGDLNIPVLRRSLNWLAERHESLRTVFETTDGVASQRVLPAHEFEFEQRDSANWEADARAEIRRPFNLYSAPPARALLLRLAADDFALLLVLHHIITDGWSMALMTRELSAAYDAFLAGEAPALPAPTQFPDLALRARAEEYPLEYWRGQLAEIPPALDLPLDFPRPPAQSFRGGVYSLRLDDALLARVRAFCATHKITPFVFFFAVFEALMYRYSRQPRFAVAIPVANRTDPQAESALGCFINTLALPVDFRGSPHFLEAIRRAQETVIGGLERQSAPFEKVVDALRLPRDLSRNALAQVMFAWQDDSAELHFSRIQIEHLPLFRDTAKFDLTFFMGKDSLDIEYNADLYQRASVIRMAEHYLRLAESLQTNPLEEVRRAELLGAEEKAALEANGKGARRAEDWRFIQKFEALAASQPGAVAARRDSQIMTYAELNDRANGIGWELKSLGVGRDALVGIYMERSMEMLAALLGVWKAGGAYVPIDPSYPTERKNYLLADSGVKIALTQNGLGLTLPGVKMLEVEGVAGRRENPPQDAQAEDLAYMIYTSGSTGKPKGAQITQGNLTNYLNWCLSSYPTQGSGSPLHSSLSFDLTVTSIYPALLSGKTVWLAEEGLDGLAQLLKAGHDFSLVKLTPAHLQMLGAQLSAEEMRGCARALVVGGENLTWEHIRAWVENAPACRVINEYGPTETTVGCSVYEVKGGERGNLPIGRAVYNTDLYVLDENGKLTPAGTVGELYIGGAGVGRGYWRREDLTRERFVQTRYGRLYKSGDLARWRLDSELEYLGRGDEQVKVRGYRIELGEVENALLETPGVKQAAVKTQDGKLVGYISGEAEAREARERLKERLPDYMQPVALLNLPALPLTINGKVDKAALPRLEMGSASAYEEPRGEVETILAEIWRELLNLPRIGRHDNFFELGGDSILGIQFISRAQTRGLRFTPRQIFELQTLAVLAKAAEQTLPVSAEQGAVRGEIPLTPMQRWFFEKRAEHPQHYNQTVLLDAKRALQPRLLARALREVLRQHDMLRACYEQTPRGWVARAGAEVEAEELLRVESLPAGGESARLAEINLSLQSSLNITSGRLLRVALLLRQDQPAQLLMVAHHLAVDFVSWQILLHDLWLVYDQLERGLPPRLPVKTSSFKAWAQSLWKEARRPAAQSALEYWLRQTKDLTPLPMDFSEDVGEDRVSDADVVQVMLPALETQSLLRDAPRAYHTQINDLLLTALLRAFQSWTGQPALWLSMEGHGRESDALDLSRTVGWFTALYPLRLDLRGEDLSAQILSVKRQLRQIPGKGASYGILRYLNEDTAPALAALPEPQVIFNYGGQWKTATVQALGGEAPPDARLLHLHTIYAAIVGERLVVSWTYSRKRYARRSIETLAREFLESLREVIAHCRLTQAGGFTVEDFPLSGLTQPQLDALARADANIEDIYPLTPMQEMILEQTLSAPQLGVYFTQLGFDLAQPLDVPRFKQAWQRIVERHDALRARFVWQGLSRPLQIIQARALPRWEEQDWRDLPPAEQAARFDAHLAAERAAGFDLEHTAPLRFSLLRLGDERFRFVLHISHLLLDGWSYPLLLRELSELYASPDAPLPAAYPYRDYIAWALGQKREESARFWRGHLADLPSLSFHQPAESLRGYGEQAVLLSESYSAALQEFSHRNHLTLNVVMQAAWALTLRVLHGMEDVCFGVTVSGRSVPLIGIEARVGMFINTLPFRVRLDPDLPILHWLQALMREQLNLEQYSFTSRHDLSQWLDLPKEQPLFFSSLRFQNYPSRGAPSGLRRENSFGVDWWHDAVNLVIVPDSRVELKIQFDTRFFSAEQATRALHLMENALREMTRAAPQSLLATLFFHEDMP